MTRVCFTQRARGLTVLRARGFGSSSHVFIVYDADRLYAYFTFCVFIRINKTFSFFPVTGNVSCKTKIQFKQA